MKYKAKLFSVLVLCALLAVLLPVGSEAHAADGQVIIDGAAYDADKMYKNGVETDEWWLYEDGWVYDGRSTTKTLNLRNYDGGAIDLSGTETWVYFYGDCVITGAEGEPGMTGGTWLYLRGNDNSDGTDPRSLTIKGGAGSPAIETAGELDFYTASYSPCLIVGGDGAPAVRVTYPEASAFEPDGHCEFISGGAEVPAIEGNLYDYSTSGTLYYAGADAGSAALLDSHEDYDGEPYLRTDCTHVTLTFDSTGGKLFGRSC
ncbi:MAG: hypothetical protein IJ452_01330 [Butyricicoccus sp.]|nr:hypothetical protein [Butyricicoccus sp.]